MELPSDPVIPLLGIYPKNPRTAIQKNIFTPIFIVALFTIAKIWKQPKCPSVDKTVVHLHNGILCRRNKESLPFVTAWMKLVTSMLSAISQAVKDKYHTISLIKGI